MNEQYGLTKEHEIAVQDAEKLITLTSTVKITDKGSYLTATELLKRVNTKYKELDEMRKSATKPLDNTKRIIMDWFRKPLERLEQVDLALRNGVNDYRKREELKRREAEKHAHELALKEAERLRKLAEKNAKKGNTDKADEQYQKADLIALQPIVVTPLEKVDGISSKKVWKFKIVDEMLIPRNFLMPNEKKIGDFVRGSKGEVKVEGIVIYEEEVISVKTS